MPLKKSSLLSGHFFSLFCTISNSNKKSITQGIIESHSYKNIKTFPFLILSFEKALEK